MDALFKVNGPRFLGIVTTARNVCIYLAEKQVRGRKWQMESVCCLIFVKKMSLTRGKT